MVHNKRYNFLAKFSIPFPMVWSVLLRVLAQKTPSDWLKFFDSQSEAPIQWFLKLTLATKRITPCERAWKTVPENGVFSCVPFCLRSLGHFARSDLFKWFVFSSWEYYIGVIHLRAETSLQILALKIYQNFCKTKPEFLEKVSAWNAVSKNKQLI